LYDPSGNTQQYFLQQGSFVDKYILDPKTFSDGMLKFNIYLSKIYNFYFPIAIDDNCVKLWFLLINRFSTELHKGSKFISFQKESTVYFILNKKHYAYTIKPLCWSTFFPEESLAS
jgi:hypothetical protein